MKHHPPGHRPRVIVRPHVRVDFDWPWEHRYRRSWSPQYMYRQVVYVDVGWGRYAREARLDIRTYYRHRVRGASRHRADVDVDIGRIEVYEDGRFIGAVRHIPNTLGRVRAKLHRGGHVQFDRAVFVVGDPEVGFELISTRHYGDRYVLDAYQRGHGYRVGYLDFRTGRVEPVRSSQLFDPYDFAGFVPIDLLPEDRDYLYDYGPRAVSYWDDRYEYDDYGAYFYGGRYQVQPRPSVEAGVYGSVDRGDVRVSGGVGVRLPLRRDEVARSYETERGVRVNLRREVEIQRIR